MSPLGLLTVAFVVGVVAGLVALVVLSAHVKTEVEKAMPMVFGPMPVPPPGSGLGGPSSSLGGLGGGLGNATVTMPGNIYTPSSVQMLQYPGVVTGNRLRRHKDYPNTFGWRAWRWDAEKKLLFSPQVGTPWHGAELRANQWEEKAVVRGVYGIHAEFVPVEWEAQLSGYVSYAATRQVVLPVGNVGDIYSLQPTGPHLTWDHLRAVWNGLGQDFPPGYNFVMPDYENARLSIIHGIVERYGKYVMGTGGWRAEWVVIRKLLAPNTEIGLHLEQAYPDVEVVYRNESRD